MQPDDFMLFPNHLSPFTDKVVIALFIFIVAKGLGLLNGLSAISSLQFNAVLVAIILLSIFGFLPQVLAVVAVSYLGSMLAFTFFSWPPEKLIMSNAAFSSLGFILGCFMLNGVVEYSDASMFIACSYLFTEVIIVLYNRYMKNQKEDSLYMNTSYFAISEDGKYEYGVVLGIIKILIIDCVIALIQVVSYERLAFPVFSIAVNIWLLSILAGNTVPTNTLSVSKLGLKLVKSAVSKKKSSKKKK
jgi:UDP-N-acetylmuramyl pentapeptide phosphotransferase/UDP-N-acetylglucosamine-1-phosphate transferase